MISKQVADEPLCLLLILPILIALAILLIGCCISGDAWVTHDDDNNNSITSSQRPMQRLAVGNGGRSNQRQNTLLGRMKTSVPLINRHRLHYITEHWTVYCDDCRIVRMLTDNLMKWMCWWCWEWEGENVKQEQMSANYFCEKKRFFIQARTELS